MKNKEYKEICLNTLIIGSGAAGYNAAINLYQMGNKDIAIVTEGVLMGTSRNTGSDKQTYYKLTQGNEDDSILKMAKTLYDGGCVDGDIALAEAAGSLRAFYHLVEIGVPFPYNSSGEYVGYKTDHDPMKRGISAGPLTSKYMTECLESVADTYGIKVFDGYQAIKLLIEKDVESNRAVGVLALDKKKTDSLSAKYVAFYANNIIWATGGEAGMYKTSVYPVSQTGGLGPLFEAGLKGKNLTESQYGLASIRFRWNLSGSFQQCIPRYVSTNQDGSGEKEFLDDFFDSPRNLLRATFLKGYQWPFDARKIEDNGSSLIDLLVYRETIMNGRRVFIDYMHNPSCLEKKKTVDYSILDDEAYDYLKKSQALADTPYERLKAMNPAAIAVYSDHGIDLNRELLEVAVCAQHNNGGISCNKWWESEIRHLFVIGEASGTHGIYRPGGTALNAGQVGGLRAAIYIMEHYNKAIQLDHVKHELENQIDEIIEIGKNAVSHDSCIMDLKTEMDELGDRSSKNASCYRSENDVIEAIKDNEKQLVRVSEGSIEDCRQLNRFYKLRSLLISQKVYLSAIYDYIEHKGGSRGSYMIHKEGAKSLSSKLEECFDCYFGETFNRDIQEITYDKKTGICTCIWRPVRELPSGEDWFEQVWKNYREHNTIQ